MSSVTLRLTLVALPRARTAVEASLPTDAGTSNDGRVTLDPDEFGIPASLTGEPVDDTRFRVPEELAQLVESALEAAGSPEVLWLQLVEPFGYLGLVPWERLLVDRFGIRVVRLPSLTLARRRPRDSLQVTVLVTVPNPRRSSDLVTTLHGAKVAAASRIRPTSYGGDQQEPPPERVDRFDARDVDRLVHAVLRGSPRTRTTVNVITTPWIYYDLKPLWRSRESVRLAGSAPRPLPAPRGGGPIGRSRDARPDAVAAIAEGRAGGRTDRRGPPRLPRQRH